MDFRLTEEQQDIKNAAKEFAEKEFDLEYARKCDAEHIYPKELVKKVAENGFIGIYIPEEYGGGGLGQLEKVLVLEEFFRVDSTLAEPIANADFGCEQIMLYGSEEQKSKYLAKVASGEWTSSALYTEPDAGSDLASVRVSAKKDGGNWVINGTKTFATNAEYASFGLVLCRTEEESVGPKGTSMIIVDDFQGRNDISISSVGDKMGIRASSTCEVAFDNCTVPIGNLIGKEGNGFMQAMNFFDVTRVIVAAQAVGNAQGAYEKALDYVRKRRQFGVPIGTFEAIQFKIAEMATKLEAARNLVYKSAWKVDIGEPDLTLSSMAKWYASRISKEVCDDAIQLHGGYGYMAEYDVERAYRNTRIREIYEGTTEIQKYTIGRALIGKLK